MDDRQPEADAAAFARARRRATLALERAVRVGAAAASAEQCSRLGPASLSETMARLAVVQRSSQQRQIAVARLNAAYARRLRISVKQPGDRRAAAFLAVVASVSASGGVGFTSPGRGQAGPVVTAGAVVDMLLAGGILAGRPGPPATPQLDAGQAVINEAAGMVAAQSGLDVADALALIRARAFADGQPAEAIAAQIVSRELDLTLPG